MIILTERLNLIASNITNGEKVADIGTDHGYLPLYLYENNISPNPILTDISKGSLAKAMDNCKRLFPDHDFDLRCGDGLEPLEKYEVDTVVIAGMGGILITDLLDWDLPKSLSFKKYIFQPRNNGGHLRRYLYERGFIVENFSLVPENKKLCEVMVVKPPHEFKGIKSSEDISDSFFDFPDELLEYKSEYTIDYLTNNLAVEQHILDTIKRGIEDLKSNKAEDDIRFREERIERIKDLLSRAK